MKAYTDIEQSKKLAEILPLESADMHYNNVSIKGINYVDEHRAELMEYNRAIKVLSKYTINPLFEIIPCWSLAVLLSILPYKIKLSHDVIDAHGNPAYKNECYKFNINRCGLFGDKWNVQYYGKHERQLGKRYKDLYIDLLLSENYNNPVDACYEMILKLHEQKLL